MYCKAINFHGMQILRFNELGWFTMRNFAIVSLQLDLILSAVMYRAVCGDLFSRMWDGRRNSEI